MRALMRYSFALFGTFFLVWLLDWHLHLSSKHCDLLHESGRVPHHPNSSGHYGGLSRRPLLVRFKWYSKKKTPVHVGYGGSTAMAILGPYGFRETQTDDWDLLWTMVPQWSSLHMAPTPDLPRPWQVHNHCLPLTNNRGISGGKVSQWQLFKCMKDRHGPKDFSYMPESLTLPGEASVLEGILKTNSSPWIIKLSMGKRAIGIRLIANPRDIPRDKLEYIAQRYIANPLLLNGRKFHVRLYLVITSVQPLRALLHREGLVLLAASNYTTDPATFTDLSVHLTNAAVADRTKNQRAANSLLLSELWERLEEVYHIDTNVIWREIVDVMAKLVLSEECDAPLEVRAPGTCFDVIGVDILLDTHFTPFVLECNNGPELYTAAEQAETRRANDKAHRVMLEDLIPLVAIHNPPTTADLESFQKRLSSDSIVMCGENGGFGGKCQTQADVDNLWRLHYEDRHLQNFERVLPSQKIESLFRNH